MTVSLIPGIILGRIEAMNAACSFESSMYRGSKAAVADLPLTLEKGHRLVPVSLSDAVEASHPTGSGASFKVAAMFSKCWLDAHLWQGVDTVLRSTACATIARGQYPRHGSIAWLRTNIQDIQA